VLFVHPMWQRDDSGAAHPEFRGVAFVAALQASLGEQNPTTCLAGLELAIGLLPSDLSDAELAVVKGIALTFAAKLKMGWPASPRGTFETLLRLSAATPADLEQTWTTLIRLLVPNSSALKPRFDRRVHLALSHIHAGASCPDLSVAEVAQRVGVSRWHLERLLKHQTGACFTQHLRARRLDLAAKLLLDSVLTVKEVAGRSGYGSSSAFCRDFRDWLGLSPREYRQARRTLDNRFYRQAT
jgi:AraC-like DNA-binding protein